MDKDRLRLQYTQKRASLSKKDCLSANQLICDRFFTHVALSSINVFHVYLPAASKKEPDTELILRRIQRDFPGMRIAIPKINFKYNQLDAIYYTGQPLQENKWGVREPLQGSLAAIKEIDMIIVPLLAFDRDGYRVGYGKGYYDRLLSTCREDCEKIGLSFFPPVQKIRRDNWDIPLNCCITPGRVYLFSNT